MFLPRTTWCPSRRFPTKYASKPPIILSRRLVRHESSEAGDHDSGHIEAGLNEGILFFDNVFPMRLQWLTRFRSSLSSESYLRRIQNPSPAGYDPISIIKRAVPGDTSIHVTGVIPRLKEGGAFLKFSHDDTTSASKVETTIKEYLKAHPTRPWWNPLGTVKAGLVRGRPWVEDLMRMPSSRIKVEFVPLLSTDTIELSQERLYSLFRPYGKLKEISSQPPDSKILPKFAYLDFEATKRAIMAKQCLHGISVSEEDAGTALAKLKISYEAKARKNWLKDWFLNHPRIVIPLLAAFVAAFTVVVFDPIRTWYIKTHITRAFHYEDSWIYQWFATRATDFLSFRKTHRRDTTMNTLVERRDYVEQIERWLMETADTFIVIQGPRGSGKKALVVNEALKNKKNKLVIDCRPLQEARGDSATISAAAEQVGYRPVFSWMNSISGLVDLAAQGATGMKTNFSETLDTQLTKILSQTATALKQIALEDRAKDERDAKMSDDVYLEAHPDRLPVVVIDNFLHKSQESGVVYDKIAEWAGRLATSNIAHVIFLTTDIAFGKPLSKALPDHIFKNLTLGDIPAETAKRFVISHLDADAEELAADTEEKSLTPSERRTDLGELDDCIASLGGRLTDLEFLARRMLAGETPKAAVREIIDIAASEVLKMHIFRNAEQAQWTSSQAWSLVKALAKTDTLRYNEVLLSDEFKGINADAVLQALEQSELVTIVSSNGRSSLIKAGKPIYQSAFRQLTNDAVLRSRLDLVILNTRIKAENESIEKYETELRVLGKLPKQPAELSSRIQWLLGKVQTSQAKIDKYEVDAGELKKILQTEF